MSHPCEHEELIYFSKQEELLYFNKQCASSFDNTIASPEWQKKTIERGKEIRILARKYVAMAILMGTITLLSFLFQKENIGMVAGAMYLMNAKVAVQHYTFIGKKWRKIDHCELAMQSMYDLKANGFHGEAQQLLSYLKRRKNTVVATGADFGMYYAAKIGCTVSQLDPITRSTLAEGPKKRWKDREKLDVVTRIMLHVGRSSTYDDPKNDSSSSSK